MGCKTYGRGRKFKSKTAKRASYLMYNALKHGFRPTGKKNTGRLKRAATKWARKRKGK